MCRVLSTDFFRIEILKKSIFTLKMTGLFIVKLDYC